MPVISELFRQGWPHDAGCQCVPCLKEAYGAALTKAVACCKRYKSLREDPAMADETARARTEWTGARQETVLAEHAFRAAEDRDRLAEIALRNLQAEAPATWNPEDGL
jgi:hypothetical protein